MKLKDIKGMSDYLENRCYCPGEIYDMTGFFYNVFKDTEECKKLGQVESKIVVLCKDQILLLYTNDEGIEDSTRFDATDHNIKEFKELLSGKKKQVEIDEFEKGATKRSLDKLMGIADAIMVSDN